MFLLWFPLYLQAAPLQWIYPMLPLPQQLHLAIGCGLLLLNPLNKESLYPSHGQILNGKLGMCLELHWPAFQLIKTMGLNSLDCRKNHQISVDTAAWNFGWQNGNPKNPSLRQAHYNVWMMLLKVIFGWLKNGNNITSPSLKCSLWWNFCCGTIRRQAEYDGRCATPSALYAENVDICRSRPDLIMDHVEYTPGPSWNGRAPTLSWGPPAANACICASEMRDARLFSTYTQFFRTCSAFSLQPSAHSESTTT